MDIILITSIIDPPKTPLSYINTRSIFSKQERFEQTKKTIDSVKKYMPDSKILLIECSLLTEEEDTYFTNNVDIFINLYGTSQQEYIYSRSKSLAEFTQVLYALCYITDNNINYRNLYKISGRYWLTDNFTKNSLNKAIIKPINGNTDNILTAIYKLPRKYVPIYIEHLKSSQLDMHHCIGTEIIFGRFIKKYIPNNEKLFVDPIGLSGFVSVCGSLYNG